MTSMSRKWQHLLSKSTGVMAAAAIALACVGLGATSARADIAPQTADLSVYGNSTTLNQPLGFGMDSAGRQYVTNNSGTGIKVFAHDGVGDVAPIATLNTGGDTINSIAFDATGGIWASARSNQTLYYFVALAPGSGPFVAVDPARTVTMPYPIQAIGISPQQKLVLMDEVYEYTDNTYCCLAPRHIRTYDLPTMSTLGTVNQVSVNGSMVNLDMTETGGAYAGAQIAFDAQGNILVGGDSGNAYLLPKQGYGAVGSSTAVPLKTWGGNDSPIGVALTSDGRVLVTTYANDGVGVRIFSASEGGTTPSATVDVSAASHTNGTRGIGVSPDGSLIKFAALSSDAIGVLALPAAPSPSPSPTQGSGGGGSGGGEVATPSPTPTPTLTPTPSVSPSVVPTVIPTATPSASPSPSTSAPAGVVLLSGTERANAQVLTVTAPLSSNPANAPVLSIPAGVPVAPVVSGLPSKTILRVKMSVPVRAKEAFVNIGNTRSNAAGEAKVPAFKSSRAGTYTIQLSTTAGKAFYLKVKVAPKKASIGSSKAAR